MNKNIGALWLNQSKNGVKFLTGNIEINNQKIKIVVFKNKNKKEAKHPDYNILLSEPKSDTPTGNSQIMQGTDVTGSVPQFKNLPDDDIAF